jgi:hypothetical protein
MGGSFDMTKRILIIGVVCFFAAAIFLTAALVFRTAEAQRSTPTRFDYAVINGSYSPQPPDGPSTVSSAVNICYILGNGCQNEEIRTEIGIAKFLQDERLENNARAKGLAQERATQLSYSRAIAKLGSEGWEMISAPAIEFDIYYTNQQGIPTVKEGNRTARQHVWFMRSRQ